MLVPSKGVVVERTGATGVHAQRGRGLAREWAVLTLGGGGGWGWWQWKGVWWGGWRQARAGAARRSGGGRSDRREKGTGGVSRRHTQSGVPLPGGGTWAAILARESSRRWEMRPSNLEFKTSMDLRKTGLSLSFAFIHSASLASILAVTASISPFTFSLSSSIFIALSEDASCFFVLLLRGKVSLACTEDVDRAAGPERGGRLPEKKRARPPRDEEGGEDEDEDSD